MNYAGLAADIFGADDPDGRVCIFCNLNVAPVGLACSECAPALHDYGNKVWARLTRRVQRQRRKGGQ